MPAKACIYDHSTSALLRLPPGESLPKGVKITLADIAVGDRLFARGTSSGWKILEARQVVVPRGRSTVAPRIRNANEDFRQGVVWSNSALIQLRKNLSSISLSGKTRADCVVATDATRFFRYAPDSMNSRMHTHSLAR